MDKLAKLAKAKKIDFAKEKLLPKLLKVLTRERSRPLPVCGKYAFFATENFWNRQR
jgi:hypothetical protein